MYDTIVDLLLLDMVDFEVILGIDWLFSFHAILDCRAKTITLAILGFPRLEWSRSFGHPTGKVISFLKS